MLIDCYDQKWMTVRISVQSTALLLLRHNSNGSRVHSIFTPGLLTIFKFTPLLVKGK